MAFECPNCGMTIPQRDTNQCPKCETSLRKTYVRDLYEIDVAHGGETWEMAERRISDACSQALYGQHRGLKVIHGCGSGRGHTSHIRTHAIPLLNRLARETGGKLAPDQRNPGAHILYFN